MTQTDLASGVFVLALPRTGSTLLRLILDTHPDVWSPDELRIGDLAAALFYSIEGLAELPGRESSQAPDLATSQEALERTRQVLQELIGSYRERKGKRVWCEKSPANLLHLDTISQVFPQARFILLHRHCFDTVASWLDSSRYGLLFEVIRPQVLATPANFLLGMVRAWSAWTEKLLAFEAEHRDRSLRLCYETIVTDPVGTSRALSSFLQVSFDRSLVEAAFSSSHHQRSHYGGDVNAFLSSRLSTSRIGRGNDIPWRRLTSLPSEAREKATSLLLQLGYPDIDFSTPGYDTGFAIRPKRDDEVDVPIREIFEKVLPERLLKNPMPASAGATYQIVVEGEGGGAWHLDFSQEPGRVLAAEGRADCRIALSEESLREIVSGRANPGVSFRQGKITVDGRFDLAAVRRLLALLSLNEAQPEE